ncbi:hypothetical protein RHGRI_037835 [Rhododendron griersonianum]|uniref:U-box domain-containing protein n=1 Tax=Rhododendron griersonianum TaxID=479676 RepID=A0AAV6HVY8_9ERIC|nr:hypothetical protein RHGRI_037835 [Rhododendron griersonianum]
MEETDVPAHFLCPISIQLMRDPVTVSTGITYDRESIERWLFSCKHDTCPVTKQVLTGIDLTPNHTLRRLIQSWCTLNAFEPIPTPKPPLDTTQIAKLIDDAKKSPEMQRRCLQRLRSIAFRSEDSKKYYLESAGAVEFLASIIKRDDSTILEVELDTGLEFKRSCHEALSILSHLETSATALKKLVTNNSGDDRFVASLMGVLRCGNQESRSNAIVLMKSISEALGPNQMVSIKSEFFSSVVDVLRDQISEKATKAALKILAEVCPWGRNRIKAVETGAVRVLVELLMETSERRPCELMLVVLDQLCGCAEGRAELLEHGTGLAIVSKKILRVSHGATDRAVKILSSISRVSATSRVLQEMLDVGVVPKLCLVMQVKTSLKTKERAKEILKLHSRVWKKSTCIPPHLLSSYPS